MSAPSAEKVVFGNILASNQVDKFGKHCLENTEHTNISHSEPLHSVFRLAEIPSLSDKYC